MEAVPKMEGLELDSADEVSGRVTLKAGVSLRSRGENIPVQLVALSPTRTRMQIMSTPKTSSTNLPQLASTASRYENAS